MGFENAEVKKQESEDTSYVDMAEHGLTEQGVSQESKEPEEDLSLLSDEEISERRTKNSEEFQKRRENYINDIEPKMKEFEQSFKPRIRAILDQQGVYPEDWRAHFKHFSTMSPEEASAILGKDKPHGTNAHDSWSQVVTMLEQEFPQTKEIQKESQKFNDFAEQNFKLGRDLSSVVQERRKNQ